MHFSCLTLLCIENLGMCYLPAAFYMECIKSFPPIYDKNMFLNVENLMYILKFNFLFNISFYILHFRDVM